MQTTKTTMIAAGLLALVTALAACSSTASTTTMGMDESMGDDGHTEFAFGSPADASESDRTIDITATDALRWEPAVLGVGVGETVTFRITNDSGVVHDFTLGDEATQTDHEAEMADMGGEMMMDEPNAIAVEPGETREITWLFSEAGTVLIGCHEPGHYAAGMVSEIKVVG